ncbi:unnamed protein product [Diatraea saccharalis]|uniref:Zinc finger PHD-type domain-containing protein n=1 Tax=Diatraea saccharalis TaxID=40085 RepID=A0A9N9RG46_9NEOP|nr:unnamed protein product [Diatraea saccharalis]
MKGANGGHCACVGTRGHVATLPAYELPVAERGGMHGVEERATRKTAHTGDYSDKLREVVEQDPSQTTQQLAAWFNVTLPTILTHLRQINKMKKYEKSVLNDLTGLQKETRVESCVAFLNRYRNEGILDRIVTCKVDWVQCDGGCDQWFHMHCVGLKRDALQDDDDYVCGSCASKPSQPPPHR